jgi:hypothetical protein
MPRYFFHVRDRDRLTSDEAGLELPDPASARAEAEAGARDMLEDALLAGEDISNQVIEVFDGVGNLVERVELRLLVTQPEQ